MLMHASGVSTCLSIRDVTSHAQWKITEGVLIYISYKDKLHYQHVGMMQGDVTQGTHDFKVLDNC
jgi:hypothetical protein